VYTVEFPLAIKKNGNTSFARKWMEREVITLNKISQTHKDRHCMCSLGVESKFKKTHESRRGTIWEEERDKKR
jgi:hypothetical protein